MNWVDESIKSYYKWLQEKTSYRADDITGWNVISTPFYGIYNDPIEIYLKQQQDGTILLSDDGVTLTNLEQVGAGISRSQKRKDWLQTILYNYGLQLVDGELTTTATPQNFPQKKHNLICAIFALSEMEVMAKNTVATMFNEDVRGLLDEQEIIYTPQFIMKGKTGIDFTFDYQVAGRDKELVIKSFNSLNKMNVPNFLFSYEDIKEGRERISGKKLESIAIVNDIEHDIKTEFLTALETHNTQYILWSKRNTPENVQKLKLSA